MNRQPTTGSRSAVHFPENASAVLINNFGYSNVDIEYVLNKFLPKKINGFKSLTKIGLVLGDKPYYASRNKNQYDYSQNQTIKEIIEQNFKISGCAGTLTMANDGNEFETEVKSGDVFQSNKLTITNYYEL